MQNYIKNCQKQRIIFSLRAQQSLKILQMGGEELALWLEERVTENPLLEWDSSSFPFFELTEPAAEPRSAFASLWQQMQLLLNEEGHRVMGEWILGNLDERGFYTLKEEELPQEWDRDTFRFVLHTLQNELDPAGLATFDLKESLLLQLARQGKKTSLCYQLIQEHLDDLLKGRFSLLQKTYGLSLSSLQELIFLHLSPLDPFPGYRLQKEAIAAPFIDIILKEEELSIEQPSLYEVSYPSLSRLTKAEQECLDLYKKEVQAILQALNKRKNTLYLITSYLIERQQSYLEGKTNAPLPLTLLEIAQEVGLHESTVARAIQGKTLSCSLGLIPLDKLLAKGLTSSISNDAAKALLRHLIHREDKKSPLSDQELLIKMQQAGIPCARRTLTKYRKELCIPTSQKRKVVADFGLDSLRDRTRKKVS